MMTLLPVAAQQGPIEIRQDRTTVNLQSYQGVPLSSTVGNPPGSDGSAPSGGAAPTPGQYQGWQHYGASSATRLVDGNGAVTTGGGAKQNAYPTLSNGDQVVAQLQRATVGAPFLARTVSFLFGSVIGPPDTDENGNKLAGITSTSYWQRQPNDAGEVGYYYSPHAQLVFAVQAGPIDVTWVKAQASLEKPADFDADPSKYKVVAGSYFPLLKKRYLVSGSPVKKPRNIYWTERSFDGPFVTIPKSRIGAVHFVYHKGMPERMAKEVEGIGDSFIIDNGRFEETRTIWYESDRNQIRAFNREGRIFMEILGDPIEGSTRRVHLGFEITSIP